LGDRPAGTGTPGLSAAKRRREEQRRDEGRRKSPVAGGPLHDQFYTSANSAILPLPGGSLGSPQDRDRPRPPFAPERALPPRPGENRGRVPAPGRPGRSRHPGGL